MSDSIYSTADLTLGASIIGYAFDALAVGVTLAVTWSCSTIMMGTIMLIATGLLMALLCTVAQMYVMFKLPAASIAGLGSFVGGTAARVTGLFSRKVTA